MGIVTTVEVDPAGAASESLVYVVFNVFGSLFREAFRTTTTAQPRKGTLLSLKVAQGRSFDHA